MAKQLERKVEVKLDSLEFSYPEDDNDVEACKARVASGMKCHCLEECRCRSCDWRKDCGSTSGTSDSCIEPCRLCSNHIPC